MLIQGVRQPARNFRGNDKIVTEGHNFRVRSRFLKLDN